MRRDWRSGWSCGASGMYLKCLVLGLSWLSNRPLRGLARQCVQAQQPGRFGVTVHSSSQPTGESRLGSRLVSAGSGAFSPSTTTARHLIVAGNLNRYLQIQRRCRTGVPRKTTSPLALDSTTALASLRGPAPCHCERRKLQHASRFPEYTRSRSTSQARLSAAADREPRVIQPVQFRQPIVELCTHITDLVFDVDGPLGAQSHSCDDVLGTGRGDEIRRSMVSNYLAGNSFRLRYIAGRVVPFTVCAFDTSAPSTTAAPTIPPCESSRSPSLSSKTMPTLPLDTSVNRLDEPAMDLERQT